MKKQQHFISTSNILLVTLLITSFHKLECQRSFFIKKFRGRDFDGIDVFITRGNEIDHEAGSHQERPRKLRPRMLQNPKLYQGDIVGPLPEVTHFLSMLIDNFAGNSQREGERERLSSSFSHIHRGIDFFLWPRAVIPFVLDNNARRIKTVIFNAMKEIEARSCVRFKERDHEEDFVHIFRGGGCYSSVGRRGGRQTLSLGRGCENYGIILHELMHVVGFYHLHQRHDRDKFLDIHWDNINPRFINNFKLLSPEEVRVDTRFDYQSIMMYGSSSFSKDRRSMTMTPTVPGVRIIDPAFKTSLSDVDVHSINQLYSCFRERESNFIEDE